VVELYDAAAVDTAAGLPAVEPLYLTLSGTRGVYEIPFVSTAGRYHVLAFVDKNINSLYDDGEDVGCHSGDVVFGESPALDSINVMICSDELRGVVQGRVDTSSVADTLKVSIVATSTTDSTLVYTASPTAGGDFEMTCVVPGRYVMEARAEEDSIFVELPDTLSVESCSRSRYVEIDFGHED
jgi:hypothetical protein